MEGKRQRGKPCKRCRDKVEEDLNIMGIKKKKAVNGQRPSRMEEIVLQAKAHNGL